MRIALLTFEALASAAPVRRFVASCPDRIALVALSDPMLAHPALEMRRTWHMLRRGGPRFVPYLLANFVLPRIAGLVWRRSDGPPARMPMAGLCARLGVPVCTVPDVNGSAFQAQLAASGAELIVTFHCDQILSAATIAAVPRGGVNVHAGPLPAQRGPVPTIHALLTDPPQFGITIHRLVPRIDAGAILAQRHVDLPHRTSALAAARLLHQAGRKLLVQTLDDIAAGTTVEHEMATLPYCGFPTAAMLRRLARSGRQVVAWRDLPLALRTPV